LLSARNSWRVASYLIRLWLKSVLKDWLNGNILHELLKIGKGFSKVFTRLSPVTSQIWLRSGIVWHIPFCCTYFRKVYTYVA
jgi:hypothetical protein